MKTLLDDRTPATHPEPFDPSEITDYAGCAGLLRERAALSARLAALLRRSLRGLDWAALPCADRDGLERVLTALGADIPLVWLIRGTAKDGSTAENGGTAKAAPAASPSRRGIESSDGSAAFLGHPPPAAEPGRRQGGPMHSESVAPDAAPGNGRCADAAGRQEAV